MLKCCTNLAVASGQNHVVVRVRNGEIFSWNEHQLISKPLDDTALEGTPIKQIACGTRYSLALSAEGKVYAWGANGLGQLCNRRRHQPNCEHPSKLTIGKNVEITQIACGDETSYALDTHGKVSTSVRYPI